MMIYVASSWRCLMHTGVCAALESAGLEFYNFKNPPGASGFHWQEVMPTFNERAQVADVDEYITALSLPRSVEGFANDMKYLDAADTVVLVLPCGKSAHLELGYAVGQGKKTAILLDPSEHNTIQPELMYKMVDYVTPSLFDLLGWLGVED